MDRRRGEDEANAGDEEDALSLEALTISIMWLAFASLP
jgi:hypothetical protein